MDAIVFDFDGVVIDSEPIHLMGFQQVLAPLGVDITEAQYYETYLGYDDRDCIRIASGDHGVQITDEQLIQLIAEKTQLVQAALTKSVTALDGALELIRAAYDTGMPLAICSGALRDEIELPCRTLGILEKFSVVVSAQDVAVSKPDPACYLLALQQLRSATGKQLPADKCIAIEDSPAGIESARSAGMKTLAVTTSYPAVHLTAADRIVESLAAVTCKNLDELTGD